MQVDCLVEAHDLIGESPLWHPEESRLYWTDIQRHRIHRCAADGAEHTTWCFDDPVCALSLTADPERLLVALATRAILWSPSTNAQRELTRLGIDYPDFRLNDGATDPNGAFWVGSMDCRPPKDTAGSGTSASIYRIMPDGSYDVVDTGYGIVNTMAWSPDGHTMYSACSRTNTIYAYDFEPTTSSARSRRILAAGIKPGMPDGSAIDSEGCLWNCRFGGRRILRLSPTGDVMESLEMPVFDVTSCAFGGPELRTLFVTSAAIRAPKGQQLAGGLFAIPMNVAGSATGRFRLLSQTGADCVCTSARTAIGESR